MISNPDFPNGKSGFKSRVLPREKRALGDAFGLTHIGVNLSTIMPGTESSMRHTHTHEDELIYVLEGELILVTNSGEEMLLPGMVIGFKAGEGDAHQLVNRSTAPARYLEVSNRDLRDSASYPDVDLGYRKAADGAPQFFKKDGTQFE
jgi:uncharacterized cupin superfamily protein